MIERKYWLITAVLVAISALGYVISLYSYYKITNNVIDVLVLTVSGFLLLKYIYQKKEFMFLKILGGALACIILARLFAVLYWWVANKSLNNFSVEDLSLWGFYLFLFSADFGALDRLANAASENMSPYRLGGLLVVVLVWLMVIWNCYSGASIGLSCMYGLFLSATGYYAFKMLIVPDIEDGFIRLLRPYHAIVTTFIFLETFKLSCALHDWFWVQYIVEWLTLAAVLFLLPAAIRGLERWYMI